MAEKYGLWQIYHEQNKLNEVLYTDDTLCKLIFTTIMITNLSYTKIVSLVILVFFINIGNIPMQIILDAKWDCKYVAVSDEFVRIAK